MKDYYLFPTEGNVITIHIENDVFTFDLKDDIQYHVDENVFCIKQHRIKSSFTREQLINQLETLLNNVKKKV